MIPFIQILKLRIGLLRQDRALFAMAKRLARALPGRTFIVGGFVRDTLLGMRSKDIDVEVYDVDAETLRKQLKKLFGSRVNVVGASFQTWKVHLDRFRDMDVSLPRLESKTGRGHKGFQVTGDPALDMLAATKRRDFTMNAMLLDPLRKTLHDPFEGAEDLKRRELHIVNEATFTEDPLRVYRAIQFAARFDLRVPKKTMHLLERMVRSGELETLSKERITGEIKKLLLMAKRPSIGFELMRDIGLIARSYPELLALIDTPQEPEWHPEGDVWIHSLMALNAAARIIHARRSSFSEEEALSVMLGSLCHDFGKPETTKLGEKAGIPRIRSLGHSRAGLQPTETFLARFSFGARVTEAVLASVLEHLKPGQLFFSRQKGEITLERYDNAVRKLLKRHPSVPWKVILAVAEADFRGRDLPEATGHYQAAEWFTRSILDQGLDTEPIQPLLRGEDLEALGVLPGKRMGVLLQLIEDERDHGLIKTKEEALQRIKKEVS